MVFELTEQENKKFLEWSKNHEYLPTAIGGRYEFKFVPTSIGVFVSVCDSITKDELVLTNFEDF